MAKLAAELQAKTGVKLLWNTCNLFSHPRYMNGASTNPEAWVVAFAGAQVCLLSLNSISQSALQKFIRLAALLINSIHKLQVKKSLEIAKSLGAENFIFWGGREGFMSILNTDIKAELDHMAAFFKVLDLPTFLDASLSFSSDGLRIQEGDRVHRAVLHRAQTEGAD